jgi:hypothetical protein
MIYKAPLSIEDRDLEKPSVFLAGSIEMDQAIDWQKQCEKALYPTFNVFNPRREQWDSTWTQTMDNPYFREQVEWELEALEEADHILLFFAEGTKSPISLLEFGLYAESGKLLVVCEEGFWRKGNVDIICHRYSIQQYQTLAQAIDHLLE